MTNDWFCSSCAVRDAGICGALLGKHSEKTKIKTRPEWMDFGSARPNQVVLIREEVSDYIFVLCEGWAFRFLQLSDGRRQITRILMPGDLFSPISVFSEKPTGSIQALSHIRFSRFRRDAVLGSFDSESRVSRALAVSCFAEEADAGELLLSLGRCSAEERIAYLLLHLMKRIASRNVIRGQRYPFPLRQQQIADFVGLTPVHVSKVLKQLRERGISTLSNGVLEVLDRVRLESLGAIR